MIRLIQRHLIIPRGDTGSFTIPTIATMSSSDVAVFTIFDCLTRSKIFEKNAVVNGNTLLIEFTHNDTVNLPPGKYVWDIKFYKNPQYSDEILINGEEVDSYYAGFTLPECDIKETGDNLLFSPNAPQGTLMPYQLDIISAALNDLNNAVTQTQLNIAGIQRSALTEEIKQALLTCFQHVAYLDNDEDYYSALRTALYSHGSLIRIEALFTQGQNHIYNFDNLNYLKQYLVVTATYEDGSSATVSDYELSGTLSAGTSVITVTYLQKTTTFNVIVSDWTESLFINSEMENNNSLDFNYVPCAFKTVPGINTYSYDDIILTAIEANFVSTGKITISKILDSNVAPELKFDDNIVPTIPIHTFTVTQTGLQKLSFSTPIRLESGYILSIGETDDTAAFAYGETAVIPNEGIFYNYRRTDIANNQGWHMTEGRTISVKVYKVQLI